MRRRVLVGPLLPIGALRLLVVVVVEHLEATHWAYLIRGEPALDTCLVEEVLEVARENHYVIFHPRYLAAYLTYCLPMVLLIELVQRQQVEPLQLQHVVSVFHHREFGIRVEPSSELHEDASLQAHGGVGHYQEEEDSRKGPTEHQDT